MAETYRKSKIEHYLERLQVRKEALTAQLEMQGISKEFICGQLTATDLIIREISMEFGLHENHSEGGDDHVSKTCSKLGSSKPSAFEGDKDPGR